MNPEVFLSQLEGLDTKAKIKALTLFKQEIYRQNLFLTAQKLLGYKDINHRTHGDMIAALEAKTKRKLIVMPRGTFKSSVSSVAYPIYLLNQDPNIRILLDGEVYTNSKNFLREIRMHLESPPLVDTFGQYQGPVWNESEVVIKQRRRVIKEASITASGIGAEKTGQHYDVIICDDLNSPSNSNTTEGREKVINHYRFLTSILEPDGILAIVGTRYASDDAIGHVLRNEIAVEEGLV